MSGIAGYFQRRGAPAETGLLEAMLTAIAHRGPDGRQMGSCRDAGFGTQVLFSAPEARFERVRYQRFPGYWIAADVRLDNRDDLMETLGLLKPAEADLSDGELVIAAYHKWGAQSAEKLRGDFAFALYDERMDEVFCARDPMGVKPFIYHLSPEHLVFASEVGGVMPHPAVPRKFNRARIAEYLMDYLEWSDCTTTFFEGISKLAPGKWMKVGRQSEKVGECWSLDRAPDVRFASENDYPDAFREKFTLSVKRRLRGAEHTGCMLSGGVDSSAIVCVAEDLLRSAGGHLRFVYSGVSDSLVKCPETPFIRAVAERLKTAPTILRAPPDTTFRSHIAPWLEQTDDPFDWRMTDIRLAVYRTAASDGCKAVLDGVDGDVTVSLPEPMRDVFLDTGSRMRALSAALLIWRSSGGMTPAGWRATAETFLGTLRSVVIPERVKPLLRSMRRRRPDAKRRLVAEELAEGVELDRRIADYHAIRRVPVSARDSQVRILTSGDLTVANDRYDRIASRCGVEPRHPFQDRDLLEFCVGLPVNWKFRGGWTKYILRESLGGVVPDVVRWRQHKRDVLWRHYDLAFTQARAEALRLIDDPSATSSLAPLINLDYFRNSVNRSLSAGIADAGDDIIQVLSLGTWMESAKHRYKIAGC
jgi:asparagine synthase (glutamine-hydrolysing)